MRSFSAMNSSTRSSPIRSLPTRKQPRPYLVPGRSRSVHWLSYRCFVAKGRERVPLFGEIGLVSQLGSADYSRPRKFREQLGGLAGPCSRAVAGVSGEGG